MKILISGATGSIGHNLFVHLAGKQHKILVLTRNAARAERQLGTLADFVESSLSPQEIAEKVEGIDAIINLAGENIGAKSWTQAQKKIIIDSRVNSVKLITEVVKNLKKQPDVVVQASAIGYYGTSMSDNILDENSPKGEGFMAEVVEKWEQADDELQDMGIRNVLLRTGVVLSRNDGALEKLALPFKMFAGGYLGNGAQYISWIHMEDEVRAIAFLLENSNARGIYNLTAPNPVQMKTFANALGRALRRPSWIHVPAPILKLFMGQQAEEMVLTGARIVPKKLTEAGFVFKHTEIDAALVDLFKNDKYKFDL